MKICGGFTVTLHYFYLLIFNIKELMIDAGNRVMGGRYVQRKRGGKGYYWGLRLAA